VGTAVVLIAVGGVLAVAVRDVPAAVSDYVDVPAVGLILVWAGVLMLAMQVVMHRPRRPHPRRSRSTYDDRTDQWYEQDVHRSGYPGETRQLPYVRGHRR
jgi:hypothetical protein